MSRGKRICFYLVMSAVFNIIILTLFVVLAPHTFNYGLVCGIACWWTTSLFEIVILKSDRFKTDAEIKF